MAIWSLRQMEQVRGAYVRAHVAHEQIERGDTVLLATRERLARELVEFCRPFAVELHEGDVCFKQWTSESVPFTEVVTACWRPTTHEAEFFGGHADGKVLEVENVGQHLLLPTEPEMDWRDPPAGPDLLTPNAVTYRLDGWDETARRWVYRSA